MKRLLLARIRIEEKALLEKFGETYQHYIATTPALLPGLPLR